VRTWFKKLWENLPGFPVPPPIYSFMLPRPFPFDTRTDDPLVVLAVAHELLPVEELGELGYWVVSLDRVDKLVGFQNLPIA
jgi:hypothetical protein